LKTHNVAKRHELTHFIMPQAGDQTQPAAQEKTRRLPLASNRRAGRKVSQAL
jgi:hypothetical protein